MMSVINQTKRFGAIVLLLTAVAGVFTGCADSNSQTTSASDGTQNSEEASTASTESTADKPGPNEVQIIIENFAFVPSEVTVAPGTKITWINKDEAPHTATSTEKKFNSGGLDTDDKYSFVLNDKGEFPYFCTLHPHMTATITVK